MVTAPSNNKTRAQSFYSPNRQGDLFGLFFYLQKVENCGIIFIGSEKYELYR